MNVTVTYDVAAAEAAYDTAVSKKVKSIEAKLDAAFEAKLFTPETVIETYNLLCDYRELTGKEYQIKVKENTIV